MFLVRPMIDGRTRWLREKRAYIDSPTNRSQRRSLWSHILHSTELGITLLRPQFIIPNIGLLWVVTSLTTVETIYVIDCLPILNWCYIYIQCQHVHASALRGNYLTSKSQGSGRVIKRQETNTQLD